ncbi:MAG TPA: hypothetical protein V6C97_37100 [Oculatellaceae cyanobacterium]
MSGSDRYVGYLPTPGEERQNFQPQLTSYEGGFQQRGRVGFQANGSFVTGTGDSISFAYANGNNTAYGSFRITGPGGRLIESGINQDGSWQTQNGMFSDLVNVRTHPGQNGSDGYVAFDQASGRTDVWKANGRQFTVDSRMAPLESQAPGDNRMIPPVLHARATDGSTTDYHYGQAYGPQGVRSQLNSYDVRDRNGNIREFAVRNSDETGSHWVTFKPQPGESGLFAGMPRDQQEAAMRQTEALARDPNRSEAPPPELAGRAVNDPYKQPFAETVSADGHLYRTSFNGERTCQGDDGKVYHWHANGMQSVTRTTPDGHVRLLASDSGTAPGGAARDHFDYDASGRVNKFSEASPNGQVQQYRRVGNEWQERQGDGWAPANIDVRNNEDGSVTIAQLQHPGVHNHDNRAVAARTIYPDGGEGISKLAPNGVLQPSEILSATGEHTIIHYDQRGQACRIDENTIGPDGTPTQVSYQPESGNPGHWQKITHVAYGQQVEDIPAGPNIGTGEISFGGYERIDHRGDLAYAERSASMQRELAHQREAQEYPEYGAYQPVMPAVRFVMPRFMLPRGTFPSDFVDGPGHRLTPVAYTGRYYPVAPVDYGTMRQRQPWELPRFPVPQGRPYYSYDM